MSDQNEIIIITAARPGLWLREKLTPSGLKRMLGESFQEHYGNTMKKLRRIDDAIYDWAQEIEEFAKQLKERRKATHLMSDQKSLDIAMLLGAINNRFKLINESGDALEDLNEKYLERFEEQYALEIPEGGIAYDLSPEDKEKIKNLREENDVSDQMWATAGFWSDLKEKWISQKMESENLKKRRQDINSLSQKAESMAKKLKTYLKEMSKARAAGSIREYLDILNIISKEQQDFENHFVQVHNKYIKNILDKRQEEAQKQKELQQSEMEQAQSEIPVEFSDSQKEESDEKSTPTFPFVSKSPPTPPTYVEHPETHKEPSLYSAPTLRPMESPETMESPKFPNKNYLEFRDDPPTETMPTPDYQPENLGFQFSSGPGKARQSIPQVDVKAFLQNLEDSSDIFKMAYLIAKFSERLEDVNPQKSIELLSIAEKILDE